MEGDVKEKGAVVENDPSKGRFEKERIEEGVKP
jgi:hypothetical protein